MSAVRVTEQALVAARAAGLRGDTEARIRRMVRRASPVTHVLGNRRFDDYVLRVEDDVVLSVGRY